MAVGAEKVNVKHDKRKKITDFMLFIRKING